MLPVPLISSRTFISYGGVLLVVRSNFRPHWKMKKVWGKDLYLISAGPELTKLGRSQHPQKRQQEIARGMPFAECTLWAVFPDGGCLEAALHKELAILHEKRGEWYRAPVDKVAQTVVRCLSALEARDVDGDP